MKVRTLTQAYMDAGFSIANPRNQWSACDIARPAVAITVWEDQIDRSSEPWRFHTSAFRDVKIWGKRVGNAVRKRHVAFALQSCGGEVSLVWIKAADPMEPVRRIIDRRFMSERIGRIVASSFNPVTGEFAVELHRA